MVPRVLVVDDHASFRRLAHRLLAAAGFAVIDEAEDGTSALAAVQDARPDVVLLDVLLPDANGFELAELIAADPDAPLVILTSSRGADDYSAALARTSARAFIAKRDLTVDRLAALLEAAR